MSDLYLISAMYFFIRAFSEFESERPVTGTFSLLVGFLLGGAWMLTFNHSGN